MGQNFHKIEAVRLEGGDPLPKAISLTAFFPFFFDDSPKFFLEFPKTFQPLEHFFRIWSFLAATVSHLARKNAGYIVVTTEQMVCILWWCHHFEMWLRFRDLVKTLNCFLYFMILQIFWNFVNFLAGQYFNISKFSGFLISLKVGIIELFYIS